jgi:hypothetical protein
MSQRHTTPPQPHEQLLVGWNDDGELRRRGTEKKEMETTGRGDGDERTEGYADPQPPRQRTGEEEGRGRGKETAKRRGGGERRHRTTRTRTRGGRRQQRGDKRPPPPHRQHPAAPSTAVSNCSRGEYGVRECGDDRGRRGGENETTTGRGGRR